MKLGIDFGTTRTVVAGGDRGNYPVVAFHDVAGDACEWFPSVVAERRGMLLFGFDALAAASESDTTLVRSFKRLLGDAGLTADRPARIGEVELPTLELVTRFLEALREAILGRSNLVPDLGGDGGIDAVIAVPANALSAQRFLTLDAFRKAGFRVRAMLNEPSAAGFEFTHRHRSALSSRRTHVVVYDLGGGTFDASLVHVSGTRHDVVGTSGVGRLGGDDFDEVLLAQVLAEAGLAEEDVEPRRRALLAEACRDAKERLNPNSRRILVDLEGPLGDAAPVREVTIAVNAYYEGCQDLVERSIEAMRPLLVRLEGDEAAEAGDGAVSELAGVYVVGGGSALPIVPRLLREAFGRRVHRSPYPSAATAIGLAIAADEVAGFELSDRFSRDFGVFRERDGGRAVTFDPIFSREMVVPGAGEAPVVFRRVYRAAHNIGHFRFVECSGVDESGVPRGGLLPFGDVLFPFDAALRDRDDLDRLPIERRGAGPEIEERYSVDPFGIVEVSISDLGTGYTRSFRLGS